MEYKRYGKEIVVRLDKGDKIAESLLALAEEENVALAAVSGIGATDDFEVGVFDLTAGDYDRYRYRGNHEINALVGNLTQKDGKPYLHLHITATGASGMVVGGHLFEGTVSLTAEIFVEVVEGAVDRKRDVALGINRITF
ncbi:MAG: DUF296 domain-containing protein [Clostridia bacterium]|nr:DUF296 domain-containing protein [Clostridia bacterium]